MTTSDNPPLTKSMAWLFALGAAVLAIGVTLALNPVKAGSWKTIFGAIAACSAILAGASTKLTPASIGGVVGRFAVAGVVVGVSYFLYAHHLMSKATAAASSAGLSVTGDTGGLASLIGSFGGVFVLLLMVIGSLSGAVIGARLRGGKGYGLIPARK
jgi:hypothetical protein